MHNMEDCSVPLPPPFSFHFFLFPITSCFLGRSHADKHRRPGRLILAITQSLFLSSNRSIRSNNRLTVMDRFKDPQELVDIA